MGVVLRKPVQMKEGFDFSISPSWEFTC